MTADEVVQFQKIKARLATQEPVQYILGTADFYGYQFRVSPAVLIPRPETEELVEWILETYPKTQTPTHLLDIGTGSGCIPITIAKKRPGFWICGMDVSAEALAIARQNAQQLRVSVRWAEADILRLPEWPDRYHLIVSNPPYISEKEREQLDLSVRQYEPGLALFVTDQDPLLFYRRISEWAFTQLLPGGHLFFECSEFHAQAVVVLLEQQGYASIELRQDLQGKDRMIRAQRRT